MSQENVEIVRRGIEANHSDDLEARTGTLLGFWDENCEYTASTSAVDTEIYHGHGGIRRYLKHLADSWEEWRCEAEEVRALSPDTVFAAIRFYAIGRVSGAPLDTRLGAVFVLSDGKMSRGRTYPTKEQALEAVGLRE